MAAIERRSRPKLTRAAICDAAIAIADRDGIDAVTMRGIAGTLNVEAMALYRHVANKDELLSALCDAVLDRINARCAEVRPADSGDWRSTARAHILSARSIAVAHPWFPGLLSTRGDMSPALMRYFDDMAGIMLAGGCSADLVHNALHTLGSRILGFSQEVFAPTAPAAADSEATLALVESAARAIPNITAMLAGISHDATSRLGWCDDQAEFEFALDLLLDGLERRRLAEDE